MTQVDEVVTTTRRTRLYSPEELSGLLSPKRVAVVGASEKPGAFGGMVVKNLVASGGIDVIPVNPRAESIHGISALSSLDLIEGHIDVVAICVPAKVVPAIVEQALELGVSAAIVFSSGFAESGTPEGIAATEALRSAARRGLRILGPNCLGLADFTRGLDLTFLNNTAPRVVPGSIGVVSQSGALGYLLTQAQSRGIGFSSWASAGNSLDVDCLDLANAMLDDPATKVVIAVFEGIEDGERLRALGKRSRELKKPIIVHKLGASTIGAQSAQSHTGTIAGSNAVYTSALDTFGFVRVEHYDEMLETARTFATYGLPSTAGIGVMTSSGGAAIVAADEAELASVSLPPLSAHTAEAFDELLPGFGVAANPADLTAEAVNNVDMYKAALRLFARDEAFAASVVPLTVASAGVTLVRALAMIEVAKEIPNANLGVVWMSEWADGPGISELNESGLVATYASFRSAMRALHNWVGWRDFDDVLLTSNEDSTARGASGAVPEAVTSAIPALRAATGEQTALLTEPEGKRILSSIGIPVSQPIVFSDPADATVASLAAVAFPAVVKIVSRTITHKWKAGGVRLGISSAEFAVAAVRELAAAFTVDGRPSPVLVESMISGDAEWFVGCKRDDTFGVVLTVGRGGVEVESQAPTLLVGDLSDHAIRTILTRTLGLADARNGEALVSQLASVARCARQLFEQVPVFVEMDINPLIETADGLIAVDSAIIISNDDGR